MRVYEELFIVKPDAPEEEVDAFVEQIKQVITSGKGTVDKVDRWGVRKLAYRVLKYNEGNYILVVFSSTPELVHEVERRMRVADIVIKFITVRVDEKQKKIEKRKKQREKRAARRPPPAIAVPASPAAGPPMPGPGPAMPGTAPAMPAAHAMPAEPVAVGPAPGKPAAEGEKE
ncbi:MAG TPA: 30S ribosomal protein S6 [Bryobacteraceae bacterium]|nr:30S ribosomal protein S6 [Bryobacteraceae bacterium]